MPRLIAKRISSALATVVAAAVPSVAIAAGRSPPISGNGWVALGVIGLLVAVVVMLIRGTMHIEERHARMYGPRRDHGHSWFGPVDDDHGGDGSD